MLSFCLFLAETLWLLALSLSGLSRSSEMGLGSLIDQDSAPIWRAAPRAHRSSTCLQSPGLCFVTCGMKSLGSKARRTERISMRVRISEVECQGSSKALALSKTLGGTLRGHCKISKNKTFQLQLTRQLSFPPALGGAGWHFGDPAWRKLSWKNVQFRFLRKCLCGRQSLPHITGLLLASLV